MLERTSRHRKARKSAPTIPQLLCSNQPSGDVHLPSLEHRAFTKLVASGSFRTIGRGRSRRILYEDVLRWVKEQAGEG